MLGNVNMNVTLSQVNEATANHVYYLNQEEAFGRQKSRIKWLLEG